MATFTLSDDDCDRIAERVAALLAQRALQCGQAEGQGWMDMKTAAEYAGTTVNGLQKAVKAQEVQFGRREERCKVWFKREWIDAWRSGLD